MKQTIIILLSILALFTSCDKDDEQATSESEYIAGTIEDILVSAQEGVGFLVQVLSSNEEFYEASIADIALNENFEVGKEVMLKGLLVDRFLEVQKVISTDNDNFVLKGTVQSVEPNESGYFADLIGEDDEEYFALFSLSNLGEKYKEFAVDETLVVVGELWLNNSEMHVTVKVIE